MVDLMLRFSNYLLENLQLLSNLKKDILITLQLFNNNMKGFSRNKFGRPFMENVKQRITIPSVSDKGRYAVVIYCYIRLFFRFYIHFYSSICIDPIVSNSRFVYDWNIFSNYASKIIVVRMCY